MKYKILFLSIILLIVQSASAWAGSTLRLNISLDKKKYDEKEPISLSFELENKSRKPVYVNKRFYLNSDSRRRERGEVYLLVTSPSGEKLTCKISNETGLPKSDYFVLLEPGEKTASERKLNIRYYFDFEKTGIYKITAVYHNIHGAEIGLNTYRDKVASKPLSLEIIEQDEN